MSGGQLEVAHELIDPLLVLGLAETGQVRVERGHRRALMPQIDLELAQVLTLLKKVRGIRMSQRVDVGCFLNAAGFEGEAKAPLQSRAAHRLGGGRGSLPGSLAFAREQEGGMAMGL